VRYINTADEPTPGQRKISVQLYSRGANGTFTIGNVAYSLITIAYINDHSPIFSADVYNGSVLENEAAGTPLNITVLATDDDIYGDTNITYRLAPGVVSFIIDPLTGIITTTDRTLDREAENSITFTVLAIDNDVNVRTGTATVNIAILDVNDNPPIFNPLTFTLPITILENMTNGSSIVSVTAIDADTGTNGQIVYQLFTNDTGSGVGSVEPFGISNENGIATFLLVRSLDRETVSEYTIIIEATDGVFTDDVTIYVNVSDVNDNAPIFDRAMYSVTVLENAPVNFSIVTVTATDADSSSNGLITYGIVQGNDDGVFRINQNDGSIILSSLLDYETTSSHNLIVTAIDMGTPALNGTAIVQVNISDINDEPPILTTNTSLVTYIENSDETLIAAGLEIIDADGLLHPLMGAVIILDVGECRLSMDELQEACQQQEPTCMTHCAERLTFDRSLLSMYGLNEHPNNTDHVIIITGNASEDAYSQVLRSFVYINFASEPYAGERTVSFQVTDDQNNTDRVGESNILNVVIRVELIDEYCPVVSSALNIATFVEGYNLTYVGQDVVFSFMDRDREPHKLLNMIEITLRNRQTEESISVAENGSLLVTTLTNGSDLIIRVQGTATIEQYRQTLQTLVYSNIQNEPTLDQRLIVISPFVVGDLLCTSYNVAINITPINDNPPQFIADMQTVNYLEESGTLLFVQSAGLQITDLDHNEIFNIISAEVLLTNIQDGNSEVIGFNITPPSEANLVQGN